MALRECPPIDTSNMATDASSSVTIRNKRPRFDCKNKTKISSTSSSVLCQSIQARANELFGVNVPSGCILALIFAIYNLRDRGELVMMQTQDADQKTADFPAMTVSPSASLSFDFLLPLLQRMVQAEAVALRDPNENSKTNNKRKKQMKKRRVEFCAFDGSSVASPVNGVTGSDTHQRDMIDALSNVKSTLDEFIVSTESPINNSNVLNKQQALSSIIQFLQELPGQEELMVACKELIDGPDYPRQRITACITMYLNDFKLLSDRLNTETDQPLSLERRLAELVGNALRYNLRVSLDEKVTRLISTASSESNSLSARFSTALECLFQYFGMDALLSSTTPQQDNVELDVLTPANFCDSPAAQQQVHTRRRDQLEHPLANVEQIISNVNDATDYLELAYCCKFLEELFSTANVQNELNHCHAWSDVKTLAISIRDFKLYNICPHDAHLVSLNNLDNLLHQLLVVLPRMLQHAEAAESALVALENRLQIATKTTPLSLLSAYPSLGKIREAVEEGRERAKVFSTVIADTPAAQDKKIEA